MPHGFNPLTWLIICVIHAKFAIWWVLILFVRCFEFALAFSCLRHVVQSAEHGSCWTISNIMEWRRHSIPEFQAEDLDSSIGFQITQPCVLDKVTTFIEGCKVIEGISRVGQLWKQQWGQAKAHRDRLGVLVPIHCALFCGAMEGLLGTVQSQPPSEARTKLAYSIQSYLIQTIPDSDEIVQSLHYFRMRKCYKGAKTHIFCSLVESPTRTGTMWKLMKEYFADRGAKISNGTRNRMMSWVMDEIPYRSSMTTRSSSPLVLADHSIHCEKPAVLLNV